MEQLIRTYFDNKLKSYDYRGNSEVQEKIEELVEKCVEKAKEQEWEIDEILTDLEAASTPSRYDEMLDDFNFRNRELREVERWW